MYFLFIFVLVGPICQWYDSPTNSMAIHWVEEKIDNIDNKYQISYSVAGGEVWIEAEISTNGRLSTFAAGIILLILILVLDDIVRQIPMAALVAVMIMVSIGTFSWSSIVGGIRGLTSIKNPKGSGQSLLFLWAPGDRSECQVKRMDLSASGKYEIHDEVKLIDLMSDAIGAEVTYTLGAHNMMYPVIDEESGKTVHLIGFQGNIRTKKNLRWKGSALYEQLFSHFFSCISSLS